METNKWIEQRKSRQPSKRTLFFRKVKMFNWKKIVLLIVVLLLICVTFFYISKSNLLSIKIITVVGANNKKLIYTSEAEILTSLSTLKDSNFFTIDLVKASNKVKEDYPFIKDVIASKDFPDMAKLIVIEREPKFVVNVNNSQCFLVDPEAYVLNLDLDVTLCSSYKSTYQSIYVDIINPLNPFVKSFVSNSYIMTKLNQLAENLNSKSYSIDRIVVKDEYCEITLINSKILVFGINDSLAEQVARFEIVLPELEKTGDPFKVLDLRYDRPIKRN